MTIRLFKAFGLVIALFGAVYAPAFAVAAGLRLPFKLTVPLVSGITLVLACLYIWLLSRHAGGFSEYGFAPCRNRDLLLAVGLAVALGLPLTWGAQQLATSDPFNGAGFRPWMLILYFPILAAVQEEVIFRGLLQTVLSRRLSGALRLPGNFLATPALAIAVLFGLIHAGFGIFTAFAALVLGILAGELRQRSGSLLPAIVVHAVFNFASLLWMVR